MNFKPAVPSPDPFSATVSTFPSRQAGESKKSIAFGLTMMRSREQKENNCKFWQRTATTFVNKHPRPPSLPALAQADRRVRQITSEISEDMQFPHSFGDINNDAPLRKEVKQLDNWVFDNIARRRFTDNSHIDSPEAMIEQVLRESKPCTLPDLDVRLLNLLLRDTKAEHRIKAQARQDFEPTISKKIAVTSETINREYNKTLMLSLIRKKLVENPAYRECNENYLYMVSKTILVDFVSSFHVLEVFKHQNILQIKGLLSDVKDPIRQVVSIDPPNSALIVESNTRSFETYERALVQNYERISIQINEKKTEIALEENRRKFVRADIDSRLERLQALVREKDVKENQSVFMRKFGQTVSMQEYVAINELKKQIETEEGELAELRRQIEDSKNEADTYHGRLQEDIRLLKFRKHLFAIKLKEFYLNIVRNEGDLLRYGKTLIDVLVALMRFTMDLKPTIFALFYQPADVDFAIRYAKLLTSANEIKSVNRESQPLLKRLHGLLFKRFEKEREASNFEGLKETIQGLKRGNLRIFERKYVKRSNTLTHKWEPRRGEVGDSQDKDIAIINTDKRHAGEEELKGLKCFANSKQVNEIGKTMHREKMDFLKNVFGRILASDRGGLILVGCPELKKLLTLMFGSKEAQAVMTEFKEKGLAAFELVHERKCFARQILQPK